MKGRFVLELKLTTQTFPQSTNILIIQGVEDLTTDSWKGACNYSELTINNTLIGKKRLIFSPQLARLSRHTTTCVCHLSCH